MDQSLLVCRKKLSHAMERLEVLYSNLLYFNAFVILRDLINALDDSNGVTIEVRAKLFKHTSFANGGPSSQESNFSKDGFGALNDCG
jgi:hypothetical protein